MKGLTAIEAEIAVKLSDGSAAAAAVGTATDDDGALDVEMLKHWFEIIVAAAGIVGTWGQQNQAGRDYFAAVDLHCHDAGNDNVTQVPPL